MYIPVSVFLLFISCSNVIYSYPQSKSTFCLVLVYFYTKYCTLVFVHLVELMELTESSSVLVNVVRCTICMLLIHIAHLLSQYMTNKNVKLKLDWSHKWC